MECPILVDEAETQPAEPLPDAVAKGKRERSLIEFPYSDLQSATDLATAVIQKGGGSCDEVQLAAWLNHSVGGGTFRSRLSAARLFGLLEGGNKTLTLTSLGRRITDARLTAEAKAEAFLRVPLYEAMYEKLNGYGLPPAAAIERQMVNLGVVQTQSDKARQVFVKSAAQAGFIDPQTGRFVRPGNPGQAQEDRSDAQSKERSGDGGSGGPPHHPFILGLLKTLPTPETDWAVADRAKWLLTASSIFGLIYKGEGSIKIEVEAPAHVLLSRASGSSKTNKNTDGPTSGVGENNHHTEAKEDEMHTARASTFT